MNLSCTQCIELRSKVEAAKAEVKAARAQLAGKCRIEAAQRAAEANMQAQLERATQELYAMEVKDEQWERKKTDSDAQGLSDQSIELQGVLGEFARRLGKEREECNAMARKLDEARRRIEAQEAELAARKAEVERWEIPWPKPRPSPRAALRTGAGVVIADHQEETASLVAVGLAVGTFGEFDGYSNDQTAKVHPRVEQKEWNPWSVRSISWGAPMEQSYSNAAPTTTETVLLECLVQPATSTDKERQSNNDAGDQADDYVGDQAGDGSDGSREEDDRDDPEDEVRMATVLDESVDEGDCPQTTIEADILPLEKYNTSRQDKEQHLKKIYDIIRRRLRDNIFDATDDQCIREVFAFRGDIELTVQAVEKAFVRKAKKLKKIDDEKPRVRHICKLVLEAMRYLQQSHHHLNDPSVETKNDEPSCENYPEYESEEFVTAASTATENSHLERQDDAADVEGDYPQTTIEADILPLETGNTPGQNKEQHLKKIYDIIRQRLRDNIFDATDDKCIREVFAFSGNIELTVQAVEKAFARKAKKLQKIHDEECRGKPPQVRHLCKLVLEAMRYLQQSHHHLNDPSVETKNDKPSCENYPEYESEEFASSASTAMENIHLTQPTALINEERQDDAADVEGDYPQTTIEAGILPLKTGNTPGQNKEQHLKKTYDIIRQRLHDNIFDATDDKCIREVFAFSGNIELTVQAVEKAFARKAKKLQKIHDEECQGKPPQVRHLCKLVLEAMRYLQQSHHHLNDPSVETKNDKPSCENYPEYESEEFASAASTAMENIHLTQPTALINEERQNDAADVEGDYPQTIIEADILPLETGNTPGQNKKQQTRHLKKTYDIIRRRLRDNIFDATDDKCIREVFHFDGDIELTVQAVEKAYAKKAKKLQKIHDEEYRGKPPQVRHLCKLVLEATRYLQQCHHHLNDPSVEMKNDKPSCESYPECQSEEFATAASIRASIANDDDGDDGGGDDDDDGIGSAYDDVRSQTCYGPWPPPDTYDAVDTYQFHNFVLSPFIHVTCIPYDAIEHWAIAYNIVGKELIEAINSKGPGRTKRIDTAARWYLGLPQLILRDGNRGKKRNSRIIHFRLALFINKQYGQLLNEWHFACEKAQRKMKPPRKDAYERGLERATNLFQEDHRSHTLGMLEGNGCTSAEDPATQQQVRVKHPQSEEGECFSDAPPAAPPPTNQNPDLTLLRKVVKEISVDAWCGPRGLRARYIKAIEYGTFFDDNAKEAFNTFTNLGILYLDFRMPPWLRQALNSRLVTPLISPNSALEIDVASWTKTLKRSIIRDVAEKIAAAAIGKCLCWSWP